MSAYRRGRSRSISLRLRVRQIGGCREVGGAMYLPGDPRKARKKIGVNHSDPEN